MLQPKLVSPFVLVFYKSIPRNDGEAEDEHVVRVVGKETVQLC